MLTQATMLLTALVYMRHVGEADGCVVCCPGGPRSLGLQSMGTSSTSPCLSTSSLSLALPNMDKLFYSWQLHTFNFLDWRVNCERLLACMYSISFEHNSSMIGGNTGQVAYLSVCMFMRETVGLSAEQWQCVYMCPDVDCWPLHKLSLVFLCFVCRLLAKRSLPFDKEGSIN